MDMKKSVLILFACLVYSGAARAADDCLVYKLHPRITIDVPAWTKEVVQPLQRMSLLHGNVVATLVDNYDIIADITPIEDGFCVALKGVDAQIGYSNFTVQIDISHVPNTCSYNAILAHEDEHIRSYLSVIDDYKEGLHKSVFNAADSIMPIFVRNESDIDSAINGLNDQLQAHPDLILIMQQIKAAEEIRNKRVDQNDTGAVLRRCYVSDVK